MCGVRPNNEEVIDSLGGGWLNANLLLQKHGRILGQDYLRYVVSDDPVALQKFKLAMTRAANREFGGCWTIALLYNLSRMC